MRILSLLIVGASLAACGDNLQATDPEIDARQQQGDQMGQQLGLQLDQELTADMSDPTVSGKVGMIVKTMDMGEIAEAQAALRQTSNSDVNAFANLMVDDHTAADKMVDTLLASKRTSPIDEAVSMTMRQQATQDLARLQTMRGADFDREYALTEVQDHAQGLRILQHAIDRASSNDLRALLTQLRGTVQDHLARARDLAEMVK